MKGIITLKNMESRLSEIILSVEDGEYSPEEALAQFNDLKADVEKTNLRFAADYTLADFRRIQVNALSTFEARTDSDELPTLDCDCDEQED